MGIENVGRIVQIVGLPGGGKTKLKNALKSVLEIKYSENFNLVNFVDFGLEIKKINDLKDGDYDENLVERVMKNLLKSDKHNFFTGHIIHYNDKEKKYESSEELEKKYKSSVIILLDSCSQVIFDRRILDINNGTRNRVITDISQISEHRCKLKKTVDDIINYSGGTLYKINNNRNTNLFQEANKFWAFYFYNLLKNEK